MGFGGRIMGTGVSELRVLLASNVWQPMQRFVQLRLITAPCEIRQVTLTRFSGPGFSRRAVPGDK